MSNKLLDGDLDFDIPDMYEARDQEEIVRRCKCGFRGALIPDLEGYACANCGTLVVDHGRRKR